MVLCSTPSPAEINSPLVLSQASSLRRCVLTITGTVLRKTINIKTGGPKCREEKEPII